MNILLVHPCKGFYGGAEEVIVQLATYLEKQEHLVRLSTRNCPPRLKTWTPVFSDKSWRNFWSSTRGMAKLADAIICFNFPATLATLNLKKKIIWYCNEPPELFTTTLRKPLEALNRWWIRKSKMVCAVATPKDAARFERIYKVKPEVVPYGVDYEFWSAPVRVEKEQKITLLQVGHEELFEGGKELLKGFPRAQIVQLAHSSREEVREWYHRAHILIHPVKSHGGWLVPFEACCAGLKVAISEDFAAADFFGCHLEELESVKAYLYSTGAHLAQPPPEWVKENLTWEKFGQSILSLI